MDFIKANWNRLLIVCISVLLLFGSLTTQMDRQGETIVTDSLKEAVVTFGVAKGLNAAISLAQGTEVGPPGLTLAVGEVLDPINDLIERFSWIMLASIASLGIQKILMNIVTGELFHWLFISMVVILNLWLFFRFKNDSRIRAIFFKTTVIVIFLRFSIPVMSLLNVYVYEHYVKSDYDIARIQQQIETASTQINAITYDTIGDKQEQENGFFDKAGRFFDNLFSKTYYQKKIEQYKTSAEETSDHILHLIIAFIFKAIFFPLVFLFLLYQLIRKTFNLGR